MRKNDCTLNSGRLSAGVMNWSAKNESEHRQPDEHGQHERIRSRLGRFVRYGGNRVMSCFRHQPHPDDEGDSRDDSRVEQAGIPGIDGKGAWIAQGNGDHDAGDQRQEAAEIAVADMVWQRDRGVADASRERLHQECGDRAVDHRHVEHQHEDEEHQRDRLVVPAGWGDSATSG